MYGLVMPVMLGATAVLQDVFEPKEMARQIAQEGVTFTMGATPFLNDLTEHVERNRASTASLRVFVSAGAPIPRPLVSKARGTLGAAIISAWGCRRTAPSRRHGRKIRKRKRWPRTAVRFPAWRYASLTPTEQALLPEAKGSFKCGAAPISSAI
jgi:cyclohexanecarboxylate-CoA ligase